MAFARQAGQALLVQAHTWPSSTLLAGLAAAVLLAATAAGATPPPATTPTPALVVEPVNEAGAGLDIALRLASTAGVPGRITIFVPRGFSIGPHRALGSTLGSAAIQASDSSSYGVSTSARLQGEVVAAPAAAPPPACTTAAARAIWQLQLSLLGQPFDVPLYLSPPDAGDPPGAGEKLTLCGPLLPATNASTVQRVLPIASLELFLDGLRAPASRGAYLWRAIVTPLGPDRTTLDPEHAYEVRALVEVPTTLTLTSTYVAAQRTVKLQGRLTALGRPVAGAAVQIARLVRTLTPTGVRVGDKLVALATTTSSGTYSAVVPLRATSGFVAVARTPATPCTGRAVVPSGCKSMSSAPAESDPVTVSPR